MRLVWGGETGQIADREGGARRGLEERMDRKVGRSSMGTRREWMVGEGLERRTRERRFEWKEAEMEEIRL